jgi:gas vesicle protein
MFAYQPQQSRAGEVMGRNRQIAAQAYADGTITRAQVDAAKKEREYQAMMGGIGAIGNIAGMAAGAAIGGPAGLMAASSGGGLLNSIAQVYGAKETSKALDKSMGMAADEGLITYDMLEKFTNLPWQQKAPVFDLWRTSMLPVQTNRMKVEDQARIWGEYRGNEPTGPSAANRYGYVYRRPGGP